MNSNKFIQIKIQELLKLVPSIEVYHEYDDFSQSHFLKIHPSNEFESNDLYIKFEEELNNDFFIKFPFEIITFLSDEDNYELLNPKRYVAPKEVLNQTNFIIQQNFDFSKAIDNLLLDYNVEIPTSINFSAIFNAYKFINTYQEVLRENKLSINQNSSVSFSNANIQKHKIDCSSDINTNNEDYCLAA